jgi:fatty-acyl-CoA synthase
VDYPPSIAALFENACRWIGPRDFLSDPALRLTGTQAGAAVRRGAGLLARLGLRPGDGVAVLAGPSTAQAVAFFAAQAAGGVVCCLHLRETDARLAAVLADLAPRILLADAGQAERAARLADAAGIAMATVEQVVAAAGDAMAPVARRPDDRAVILLSSGTTGMPKKVLHSHRSMLATARMAAPVYGAATAADGVAVPMAPSFAAWVHTVLPFVALRGRIAFVPRFEVDGYVDTLAGERLTVAALVPTLWTPVVAQARRAALPHLRVAMFSGEPGTPDLVAELCALVPAVRSVHLASEGGCACGIVATEADLSAPGGAAAAGRPVPGGDAMVVDPDAPGLRPLPPGQTGEIALRGASMAQGYLDDPAQTAARFTGGWWRSGDLGRLGDDGLLYLRGRTDNRINSGGIKIHAEEVEAALRGLGLVRAAAVVGVPDPTWGERIEAHVVPADPSLTGAALAEALDAAGVLPRALMPKAYHLRDSLPVGPTGKLYRQGLRETPH